MHGLKPITINLTLHGVKPPKQFKPFKLPQQTTQQTNKPFKPHQPFKPIKHPLLPFDSAQGKLAQYKLPHLTRLSLVSDKQINNIYTTAIQVFTKKI